VALHRYREAVPHYRQCLELGLDEPIVQRRRAACAAMLAAAGQGEGGPLDDNERAALRRQAAEWLKADLALCQRRLEKATPKERDEIRQRLEAWRDTAEMAGIRAALAKLPDDERAACRGLWAEVEALLTKSRAPQK
jgi:hypothetical protein